MNPFQDVFGAQRASSTVLVLLSGGIAWLTRDAAIRR
jgi:hypothetical protein